MIIKELETKEFNDFNAKIQWIVENKSKFIKESAGKTKFSDCVAVNFIDSNNRQTSKENTISKDELTATLVINTTNILDSHGDVHIPGLWDKSLSDNTRIMHLQEHKMEFDKIIADKEDINAYVRTFNWKELGYDVNGTTQALIFESNVRKDRNQFMFNQYSKGYVRNHSVGMQYVNLELAVNEPNYKEEYEVWLKYIDTIANKALAESIGYFWAVTEAKVFEGSAVPMGSNQITPTLNIKNPEEVTEEKTITVNEDEYYQILHRLRANKIKILK